MRDRADRRGVLLPRLHLRRAAAVEDQRSPAATSARWVAAIVTGILFGLAHTGSASSQYLIPLGFLGFVLCLVRWKTRSLYPCMALHSVNNSLALGVNQLHWNAREIFALIAGSLVVIAIDHGPLARRTAAWRGDSSQHPGLIYFRLDVTGSSGGAASAGPGAVAGAGAAPRRDDDRHGLDADHPGHDPDRLGQSCSIPGMSVDGPAEAVAAPGRARPRRSQGRGVRPVRPGQWVTIRGFVGRRLIKRDRLRIKPSPNHSYGRFVETLSSPSAGEVVVYASHARTPQMTRLPAQRALPGARRERRPRLDRAVRPARPAAARRAALLHPADRRLRQRHRARDRRLPPAARVGHLPDARRAHDQLPAERLGPVQGPLPQPRSSRRGRPLNAAAWR